MARQMLVPLCVLRIFQYMHARMRSCVMYSERNKYLSSRPIHSYAATAGLSGLVIDAACTGTRNTPGTFESAIAPQRRDW